MITNFLLKLVVGEDPDFSDNQVRARVGFLGGLVGIIINSGLFLIKLILGIGLSSIAVLADAFNNLSDAGSSLITIVGFKLSNLPADKEHPYGHGRLEYISGLIVSFMVILVGFQFIKSSIDRIINPVVVEFQKSAFIILLLSIILKIWLSIFNKKLGNKIDSTSLKATATDALGDVLTSSVVSISLLSSLLTSLPLDGYIGLIVAIIIIYAGISLVTETISPLIGEAPSEELIKNIKNAVLSYDYITDVHDLRVHNYGPGRTMASIHAEFPSNIHIMDIHSVIDLAERQISKELDIDLIIHMDPVSMDSEEIIETRSFIENLIEDNPYIISIHDFRIVGKGDKKNLIFDIVVNGSKLNKEITEDKIKYDLIEDIKKIGPNYNFVITVDKEFL